ncbi:heavy metal-associated isoprenylated plant protein 28 [Nymphaea colorata]|nr:heavy metal-associated isoprenylated plant protein 28 [Nymphaea colorata]
MRVHMDCAGCEIKIRKALQRLQGVDSIDIDMRMQKVTVTGHADPKKVLKTVRKTGRRAELWPSPYNTDHAYIHHYHHHQYQPPHATSRTSSSYNYYKHGYDGHMHGYYHGPPRPSLFSDENPHACSIM